MYNPNSLQMYQLPQAGSVSGSQSMTQDQSLSKDLGAMYKNEALADVTLVVNDKPYRAHKVILAARSPIFASIFASQTDNEVKITDMEPEVMEEVLRYIYTGNAEKLDQLARDLIVAADKYCLEGLLKQCENFILRTISVSNALDVYKFADEKGSDEFKQSVINFVVSRFSQIMNTENWKNLNSDEINFKMTKQLCEAFSKRMPPSMTYSGVGGGSVSIGVAMQNTMNSF